MTDEAPSEHVLSITLEELLATPWGDELKQNQSLDLNGPTFDPTDVLFNRAIGYVLGQRAADRR